MSPRVVLDSYTNEPYKEEYQSAIKRILEPRSLFKKNVRVSGAYKASREEDGRWRIWRLPQPARDFYEAQPLVIRDDEAAAVRTLHWLVAHDLRVVRALKEMYADEPSFDTFIDVLTVAQEV